MLPTRQVSPAQQGSLKSKKKNNQTNLNPNKAKLHSSSNSTLQHPNNSNLITHLWFRPLLTLQWQSQACLRRFSWRSDRAAGRAQTLFGSESWMATQFS